MIEGSRRLPDSRAAALLAVALLASACGGGSSSSSAVSQGTTGTTGVTGTTGTTGSTGSGGFTMGTPGPWPVGNVVYGAADGIRESPVVAMTTDEAQNRWVATHDALYLLAPGSTAFQRYDQRDGLHFQGNPVHYCNGREIPAARACTGGTNVEAFGQGEAPGIISLAGGEPGEVFVGYAALHPDADCNHDGAGEDWCDPTAHSGKIDRVRLRPDGTLQVDRFDLESIDHGGKYWHDRNINRLLYDHRIHPHTLYAASEHGVDALYPDKFRLPNATEAVNSAYREWMGDHLHARVCFEKPCDATDGNQRIGDWRGLALDASGDLWHAGRWTAGLIRWDPDPVNWVFRGGKAFEVAFGDPYGGPGSGSPPVFEVAKEGHSVYLSAVAVCPDGKVWFGSLGPEDGVDATIASYDGHQFQYLTAAAVGLPERAVRDMICLPDGRLAIASPSSGLVLYDPTTKATTPIRAGGLIPSDEILSLELDTMPTPPTLHVATAGGAAAIRVLP